MAKTGSTIALPEPAKVLALPTETATLVNITAVKLPIKMFTFGNYTLPFCTAGMQTMREVDGTVRTWPCRPGQEWAAMKLRAARGTIDYGEKHRNEFVIHAREIALDLARECNSDLWGIGHSITGELGDETVRGFAGVFLADGERPTSEELAEMRELLRLSDAALVEEGHKTWDQFGKPDYIHEGFKRAARRIGVTAEWLYTVYNVPDCPHCGSKLKSATASVCATCHRDVVPVQASAGISESEKDSPDAKPKKGRKAAA